MKFSKVAVWAVAFMLVLTRFMGVEVHAGKAQRLESVRSVSRESKFEQSLGEGQRVIDIYDYPDGRGFVADLEVIEQTQLYGPDISELRMSVRCVLHESCLSLLVSPF